eukprot:CAMPEP_0181346720 /NCGR_PEP_ID=MMETSP1101-20121128/33480_1 /TAXON_ID=46948 /ORGANISM="Rhodomonas abbreviata, Strain Caron Lab Isolate" /LENGTH=162 /DNA_ID=CAMNT_0023458855 /DNA_START=39 /DNA_END=527 /DNA_ORIENTATION=+
MEAANSPSTNDEGGGGGGGESGQELVTLQGGCHCGKVRFEVQTAPDLIVWDCTCSICKMKRNTHFVVPESRFRLLAGGEEGQITTYTYNTHVAKHMFCSTCGVQSFYIPRSNPDGKGITVWCIDAPSATQPTWWIQETRLFDGQDWEKHIESCEISAMSKEG